MKILDDDGQVIAEGQVLILESCDVVVFTTSRSLRPEECKRIVEQLRLTFPDNKVSLIMGGDEISLLRQSDAPAKPLPQPPPGEPQLLSVQLGLPASGFRVTSLQGMIATTRHSSGMAASCGRTGKHDRPALLGWLAQFFGRWRQRYGEIVIRDRSGRALLSNCRTCGTGSRWWLGYSCPNCGGDVRIAGSGSSEYRERVRRRMAEQSA